MGEDQTRDDYPVQNREPEGHCHPVQCVLAWDANVSELSDDEHFRTVDALLHSQALALLFRQEGF